MTKVIRDKEGNLINIGDWDYKIRQEGTNPPPDEDLKGWDFKYIDVIDNPLPEGATEHDESVEVLGNGARVLKNNAYKAKREIEYGSVKDQLDYIVNNGIEAFIKRNKDIKGKHPKT